MRYGLPERILNLAHASRAPEAPLHNVTSDLPLGASIQPLGLTGRPKERDPDKQDPFLLAYPKGFEPSTFRVGV